MFIANLNLNTVLTPTNQQKLKADKPVIPSAIVRWSLVVLSALSDFGKIEFPGLYEMNIYISQIAGSGKNYSLIPHPSLRSDFFNLSF
jgi:hypothetical protein